ncbi:MAG TPA: gliding motility-associated C-terminal domain-containing protein [Lentimicrobium sp.]|nr:gliding motility-associated C-terminal domain-containing protein [Lentimicrobium sp.]
MKKICLIAFLTGLIAITTYAQNRCSYVVPRQADNWLFYFNAGIRFTDAGVSNNNLPAGIQNLAAGVGCSALSDSSGNLLLYSSGNKIFNSAHTTINAGNLKGDPGSPQSSLIIQNPVSSQMLYVFTTGRMGTSNGLNYSRVDMTARAGNGDVMEVDVPMLSSAIPMLCGVKNSDGTGYWVMTHDADNNDFYAYEVNASGVNTNPVKSSMGQSISSDAAAREYLGTMKFSPKGDKIAIASFGQAMIHVFSFDNATGKVSNPSTINVTVPSSLFGPFWIEFSPDGNKLYATVVARQNNGKQNVLYQYDLLNGALETQLNPTPAFSDDVVGLQLGRDGKIYVLRQNKMVLGAIENPNRPGIACNYDESFFGLDGALGFTGLPNFVSSFLDIPPVNYDTKCEGDGTIFTLLNTSNTISVDWDFGDPDSPDNIVTGDFNPTHVFSKPGDYTVTWTEHTATGSYTFSTTLTINPLPIPAFDLTLQNDTAYIVDGSSITLYANENMYSYFWQDASTNISYTATEGGVYTVRVEDWNCCQQMDTLYVLELNIKVPSAFSPDGNGLNEEFRALSNIGDQITPIAEESMTDFSFSVFNNWGQMLWETNDVHRGWNGKVGSAPAAAGLYYWHIKFNVPGNTMNNGMMSIHGTVMLFR